MEFMLFVDVTPVSTFTLKRQAEMPVPEIVPKILRTTRSQARTLLDKGNHSFYNAIE